MKTPGSEEGAAPARTRPVLRRLSLFLVALVFAAFAASALAGSHAAKGSFQINDLIPANSQGPVFSNPSGNTTREQCGTGAVPTQFTGGPFHYKVYRFENISGWWAGGSSEPVNICTNVGLRVHSGSAAAALHYKFDPAQPGVEFLGSVGGLGAGQSGDFSTVVAGHTGPPTPFEVVVYETTPNGGASYSLVVEGTGIAMVSSGTPTAADGIQSFRASSAPKGVLVRWRTRSERNALGFNLYRGAVKRVRLARSLVRASGNGRGHTYSYLDRSARKGTAVPYYLEVVQRSGSKIMFGPALRTAR